MSLTLARHSRALLVASVCAASLVAGAAVEQSASGRPEQARVVDAASAPLILTVAEPDVIDLARHAFAMGIADARTHSLRSISLHVAARAAAEAKARAAAKAEAAAAAAAAADAAGTTSNTYSGNSLPVSNTPASSAPAAAPKPAAPKPVAPKPVAPKPTPKPAPPSGSSQSSIAYSVLSALNAERAAHGAAPLSMSSALISSAHHHNLAMAAANTMSHQEPGEAYFSDRISNAGYNWNACAENIGWNSDMSTSGALALETEMYAEGPGGGHYDNIVNKSYRNVGIDVYFDNVHHKLWLTEDFGDPA
jgi:uncharacterized protein YkwD